MNEVKLIIWDLDDALWHGTLADHDEVILNQAVVEKIQFLLNRGIMHSICSKNDSIEAETMLKKFGIYDLFIFPMIAFEDKGLRVKEIIKRTQLREQNVLFVDDNPFVLKEVAFHNPKIMTQLIDEFLQEDISTWGKNDSKRERLSQYKILEAKEKNKIIFLEKTNDEQAFLKECMIEIQLIPLKMEDNDIERVIELVNRSNQMNFTKSRIPYDYLFTLFELKNGINFKIHVKDKYGDYGIGGYICILNNTLVHFVFSCRLLGMCVEARVYQWIQTHYPAIKTSFHRSVLKNIDANLDFITITITPCLQSSKPLHHDKKILLRGPCLANAISFRLLEQFCVEEEIFSFFEYANLLFLRQYLHNEKDARFEKTAKALHNHTYGAIVNFLESDYYSGLYMIKNQLTPVSSHYIFWKSLIEMKQDNLLLSKHFETM
ncbi:MAG TPA: hydrolase, partial [Legionellaceae bacterium]|nr:hydrolase [Legionellaceae bacterium]